MKHISLAALALLMAAPASAGGVVDPAPLDPVIISQPDHDWTGFYAGAQLDLVANAETTLEPFGQLMSFNGELAGLFAGYRYDFGDIVLGGEIDYMRGTYDVDEIAPNILLLSPEVDVELLRAGIEVGYDLGDFLPYATAGYAHLTLDYGGFGEDSGDGWFAGIGADYRVSENVTVGAELLHHQFEFNDFGLQHELTTVGINVAFTF
ncbi:outer membrane protein [Jannaschia sp. CCS1]|uniref:outer membrane protein n=1 Tax=Jannaschia sp. (strain CCS1) TaxID=290400 RepID=UPI000053DBAD|nr:outer membrane beta-barrel protein [Jannaschia sp. CCS1]ABD53262.1 hypothetical protein Jann_0345 [Jannaschia sp. CCS1]